MTGAIASGGALAGASLPLPEERTGFDTHAACVAALHELHAQDEMQIVPLARSADGRTREVRLATRGVETPAPDYARYEATLWFHHGAPRAGLQPPTIEVSHSFERRVRECRATTLGTTGEMGHTLSTLEPAPSTP